MGMALKGIPMSGTIQTKCQAWHRRRDSSHMSTYRLAEVPACTLRCSLKSSPMKPASPPVAWA